MEVVCGIRPEDIDDSNYLPQGIVPANMVCNVEVVEQMGNEVIIYLEKRRQEFHRPHRSAHGRHSRRGNGYHFQSG